MWTDLVLALFAINCVAGIVFGSRPPTLQRPNLLVNLLAILAWFSQRSNGMARHFSKVLVELPDSPTDPDVAIITIECETCGTKRIQIHPTHLGTVARVLTRTIAAYADDSTESFAIPPEWQASTETNRQKVLKYLNDKFPGWRDNREKVRDGR